MDESQRANQRLLPTFEKWDPPTLLLFAQNKDQILRLVAHEGRARAWNRLADTKLLLHPQEYDAAAMEFLLFVLEHSESGNGENFQDLWVLFESQRVFKSLEGGFFVEFGAADGLAKSNTWSLEHLHKWQGIVAEPNPYWHAALQKNRRCKKDFRCVWNKSGAILEFVSPNKMPLIATIDHFRNFNSYIETHDPQTFQVTTVSINDLLEQHECPDEFHYISIDTEGSEMQIISALDFQRWRPKLISIEHNYETTMMKEMREFLVAKGYQKRFGMFSRNEDWWIDTAHAR